MNCNTCNDKEFMYKLYDTYIKIGCPECKPDTFALFSPGFSKEDNRKIKELLFKDRMP
jgi:hypothetical protein